MIRFDNLFGSGGGQIAAGSTITNATLSIYVTGTDSLDWVNVHRMLTNWSEASTWNSLTSGVQANNVEASSTVLYSIDAGQAGWITITGITSTVQAWANGEANFGFALLSNNADGWSFNSSEFATASLRPYLSVTFQTPQSADIDLDSNNSSGASGSAFQRTWTENGGAVTIADSDAVITDADSSNLQSMTVTITNPLDGALETLTANTSGTSITATYDSGTGILTLSGNDSVANYQSVLRTVSYNNSSESPNTTSRLITVQAADAFVSSNLAAATITINAVNDAPVLDASANMSFTSITEDQLTNSGQTVASIISSAAGDRITDVDSGAVEGIAITATTNGNGAWEYSIDNGSNWLSVGAVANNSALLLRSSDLVRFVPNGQNATTGDITFRAWDQTSGAAGNKVDASTNGTTTAFSTTTEVASITVTAVNDAPVLDNTGNMTLTAITEDATTNSGNTVASIISSASGDRITDVDSGAVEGIAITATTNGNGAWEYSIDNGSNWLSVGAVANNSALLLRSTDLVRFVPNGQNATSGDITFRAWDQTTGSAGNKVDATTNGTTTAFSTATEVASITITAVNDAPVLDNTGNMTLTTITEDANTNSGNTVASIISSGGGDRITDVDTGAVEGIAMIATTNGNGAWEYSIDNGSNWLSVGSVSDNSALLLRSTDLVRFVPNGENATTGDITFRAWDQTSGAAGNKVDASINGTTTAFSTATEVASITVTSVNDAPVLDNTGNMTLTTITEDETTNSGNTVASIISSAGGDRITDVDSGAVEGIAITATTNGNGSWEYSIDNGSNWLSVGLVANNNALLLRSTDLVRFVPNGQNATTGDITFRAWDQTSGAAGNKVDASTNGTTTAFSTATEVASITVTAVNDAPVLDNTGNMTLTTITEDATTNSGNTVASIISSASGDRITDIDSGAVEGIAITSTTNGNGAWEYSIDNGSNWLSVGSVANNNALLLRSTDLVRFVPNGQNATTGDITFRAWDQTSGAAGNKVDASTNGNTTAFSTATEVASITVTAVNDAPVLDNTGNMTLTAITEDATTNSGNTVASIISSAGGDRITDVDTGAVEGIAITATTNGNGAWEYSIDNGSNWVAVGSVADNNALLLRSTDLVRFVPNGQNSTTGDITFRAWDQTSGAAGNKVDTSTNGTTTAFSTATEVAAITVTAVNDAPVLDNTGIMTLTTITEDEATNSGNTVASIISSVSGDRITDVDSGAIEGIAITATTNGNGSWEYSIDNGSNWLSVGAVANNSVLLLRSSDLVRFVPNGQNATTGDITFRAWDQTSGAAGNKVDASINGNTTAFSTATEVASITVTAVNDAPVLDSTGNMTLTTITEDETTNGGNTVASIILSGGGDRITDVDTGAVEGIAITATTNGNGAWEYSIDNGSNWLSVGSIANNNALLLRSTDLVRFVPNGQNATTGDISFRAWDQTSGSAGNKVDASINGTTNAFSTATEVASISVTAVNDAPVLDNTGNMTLTTITEDETINGGNTVASIISSAGGDRITDVDSGAIEGIAIIATTNGNGSWEYSIDNGSNWLSVGSVANNNALLLRSSDLVRFVPNGQNATSGDITFRAWDQTSGAAGNKVDASTNGNTTAFSTSTEVASITVTAVNDAPVLDNTGNMTLTTITEDQTTNSGNTVASIISSAGGDRITDVDSGAIEGIAITATTNGNGYWEYSMTMVRTG